MTRCSEVDREVIKKFSLTTSNMQRAGRAARAGHAMDAQGISQALGGHENGVHAGEDARITLRCICFEGPFPGEWFCSRVCIVRRSAGRPWALLTPTIFQGCGVRRRSRLAKKAAFCPAEAERHPETLRVPDHDLVA